MDLWLQFLNNICESLVAAPFGKGKEKNRENTCMMMFTKDIKHDYDDV